VRKSTRTIISERGAGRVLAIGILIAVFGIFSVGAVFSTQILEFTRLQAQTDSIALASADALRGISSGYPCIVAKDIAANNQIELKRCRIVGFEVFIETSLNLLGFSHNAKARAGPGDS
jgi:secretion/DNA translocation related TadE-like protein